MARFCNLRATAVANIMQGKASHVSHAELHGRIHSIAIMALVLGIVLLELTPATSRRSFRQVHCLNLRKAVRPLALRDPANPPPRVLSLRYYHLPHRPPCAHIRLLPRAFYHTEACVRFLTMHPRRPLISAAQNTNAGGVHSKVRGGAGTGAGGATSATEDSVDGSIPAATTSSHLLCRPHPRQAKGSPWVRSGDIWGTSGVGVAVLEAEVIQPPAGAPNAPPVLNVLAVITQPSGDGHGGLYSKKRKRVVTFSPGKLEPLISRLQCGFTAAGGSETVSHVRPIWFQDAPNARWGIVGVMLQCAAPRGTAAFTATIRMKDRTPDHHDPAFDLNMCPTPRIKRHTLLFCTSHQYRPETVWNEMDADPVDGGRHAMGEAVGFLEYHRLAGVGHVVFLDRPRPGSKPGSPGWFAEAMAPYVAEGFVEYRAEPPPAPMDWWERPEQMFANTQCYMQNRHRAEWIGTVDLDERLEVRLPGDAHPRYLPEFLDSLSPSTTSATFLHCQLLTVDAEGEWHGYGFDSYADRDAVLDREGIGGLQIMRNCRADIEAPKTLGRADLVPFSFIHAVSCPTNQDGQCKWRWDTPAEMNRAPCMIRSPILPSDGIRRAGGRCETAAVEGLNHGKFPPDSRNVYLNFNGRRQGAATAAFGNVTLNQLVQARLRKAGLLARR